MSQRSCTFVIPAYNEATRLSATLNAIGELAASDLGHCEIIVVDDGSTDGTADIARHFVSPQCETSVVRMPHRGKGAAIRHGVSFARGEIVVLCDADLQDSVREVLCLIKAVDEGADIAIGSRWLNPFKTYHAQPLYRRVSSRMFNIVASHILALPFKDTQCGLKLLTSDAAHRIFPLLSLAGWGYDTELIHLALALHLRIEEVHLHLVHDYRNSHFRPVTDGIATLRELFRIRWNEARGFYGRPGLRPLFSSRAVSPNGVRSNAIAEKTNTLAIPQRDLGLSLEKMDRHTAQELQKISEDTSSSELAA